VRDVAETRPHFVERCDDRILTILTLSAVAGSIMSLSTIDFICV
jgi:hypothetical protein